jgi:hypothetical protein
MYKHSIDIVAGDADEEFVETEALGTNTSVKTTKTGVKQGKKTKREGRINLGARVTIEEEFREAAAAGVFAGTAISTGTPQLGPPARFTSKKGHSLRPYKKQTCTNSPKNHVSQLSNDEDEDEDEADLVEVMQQSCAGTIAPGPATVVAAAGIGFMAALMEASVEDIWIGSAHRIQSAGMPFSGAQETHTVDIVDHSDVVVLLDQDDVLKLFAVAGTNQNGKSLRCIGASQGISDDAVIAPWSASVIILTRQCMDALIRLPSDRFTWRSAKDRSFAERSVQHKISRTDRVLEDRADYSGAAGIPQAFLDTVEQAAGCTSFCGRAMVKHGIMPSVLAVLSQSTDSCLKQGINNVYQQLVSRGFQTSLQPCHIALFAMTCDPVLDLNIFSPLELYYSPPEARRRRDKYAHYEDKPITVQGEAIDLTIIGTSVLRLDRALEAYLSLLDILYAFRSEVREALRAYRGRMVDFASRHSLGEVYASLTTRLIQVCLREFASELKFLFESVGGRSVTSAAQFVSCVAGLPNCTEPSTLMEEMRGIHMEKAVESMGRKRSSSASRTDGSLKNNRKLAKDREPAAVERAKSSRQGTGVDFSQLFCKYFCASTGCNIQNCQYQHKIPDKGSPAYDRVRTVLANDARLQPSAAFLKNK